MNPKDSLTFSIVAVEFVAYCFDTDEVGPAYAQFVDEDDVCPPIALSAGVRDSRIADRGKLELVGELLGYDCLASRACVDQKAEWAAIIDHDHNVWLATDDFHVGGVNEILRLLLKDVLERRRRVQPPILARIAMASLLLRASEGTAMGIV